MALPLQRCDKWTLKTDNLSLLSIEQPLGHRDRSDVFFKLHPAVNRVCSLLRNKCQAKGVVWFEPRGWGTCRWMELTPESGEKDSASHTGPTTTAFPGIRMLPT